MSVKCEYENCIQNCEGECIRGGKPQGDLCEDLKGDPVKTLVHCSDCGDPFDPAFKGSKGECPFCDPENAYYQ